MNLKELLENSHFSNSLKKNWRKISFIFASVLILVCLWCCYGCQGLANANGDNNQIVISKEHSNVSQEA